MVDLSEIQLFESDEHERQRSIMFAIVVATGFLTVAAGTGVLAADAGVAVGIALLLAGVVTLGVGAAIAMGRVDHLLFD